MKQLYISFFIAIGFTINLNGQVQLHNSWQDPVILCAAQDFSWDHLYPANSILTEEPESCIRPFEDLSSVWFRFKIENPSWISFNIKPLNPDDDIDFVIYSSKDGKPQELLRCMSTGLNLDRDRIVQQHCSGATGLVKTESDIIEDPGCSSKHNNFLRSIEASKGEEFLLEITNYKSSDGFAFHWIGNAILSPELCFGEALTAAEALTADLVRINASPNPTKDMIQITIISSRSGEATISLFNSNGLIVDQEIANLISGTNDFSISAKNFSPGTYYLNLIQENLKSETVKIEIVR